MMLGGMACMAPGALGTPGFINDETTHMMT